MKLQKKLKRIASITILLVIVLSMLLSVGVQANAAVPGGLPAAGMKITPAFGAFFDLTGAIEDALRNMIDPITRMPIKILNWALYSPTDMDRYITYGDKDDEDATQNRVQKWFDIFTIAGLAFIPLIAVKMAIMLIGTFVNPTERGELKDFIKYTILYLAVIIFAKDLISWALGVNDAIVALFKAAAGETIQPYNLGYISGIFYLLATLVISLWALFLTMYISLLLFFRKIIIGVGFMLLPVAAIMMYSKTFRNIINTIYKELLSAIFQQAIYAGTYVVLYDMLTYILGFPGSPFKLAGPFGDNTNDVKNGQFSGFSDFIAGVFYQNVGVTFNYADGSSKTAVVGVLGPLGWGILLYLVIKVAKKIEQLFQLQSSYAPTPENLGLTDDPRSGLKLGGKLLKGGVGLAAGVAGGAAMAGVLFGKGGMFRRGAEGEKDIEGNEDKANEATKKAGKLAWLANSKAGKVLRGAGTLTAGLGMYGLSYALGGDKLLGEDENGKKIGFFNDIMGLKGKTLEGHNLLWRGNNATNKQPGNKSEGGGTSNTNTGGNNTGGISTDKLPSVYTGARRRGGNAFSPAELGPNTSHIDLSPNVCDALNIGLDNNFRVRASSVNPVDGSRTLASKGEDGNWNYYQMDSHGDVTTISREVAGSRGLHTQVKGWVEYGGANGQVEFSGSGVKVGATSYSNRLQDHMEFVFSEERNPITQRNVNASSAGIDYTKIADNMGCSVNELSDKGIIFSANKNMLNATYVNPETGQPEIVYSAPVQGNDALKAFLGNSVTSSSEVHTINAKFTSGGNMDIYGDIRKSTDFENLISVDTLSAMNNNNLSELRRQIDEQVKIQQQAKEQKMTEFVQAAESEKEKLRAELEKIDDSLDWGKKAFNAIGVELTRKNDISPMLVHDQSIKYAGIESIDITKLDSVKDSTPDILIKCREVEDMIALRKKEYDELEAFYKHPANAKDGKKPLLDAEIELTKLNQELKNLWSEYYKVHPSGGKA